MQVTELVFYCYNRAVQCLYKTLSDAGCDQCVTTMITTMEKNSWVLTLPKQHTGNSGSAGLSQSALCQRDGNFQHCSDHIAMP